MTQSASIHGSRALGPNSTQISVVAACFNEEAVLAEFYRRVRRTLDSMHVHEWEILLVDDGSDDSTWQLIESFALEDERVRGVRLSRNHGHQLALSCGLEYACGARVLILDADLQDPPELLPGMMALMDNGADVVYGQRVRREGIPLRLRFAYKAFYKILSFFAGCDIPPDSGDFRLISRRVVDVINAMPESDRFLRGMISWIGFRQEPIRYDRAARAAGESKYSFRKLMHLAMDGILNFSIKPLRFASVLSFLLAALALVGAGYLVYNRLVSRPIEGWTSMIVVSLFIGSLQLLVLGVVGEYLGRLFVQAKGRPLFIVEQTTDLAEAKYPQKAVARDLAE